MLYFDILEPIRVLPDEDKGRLLVAILEYGKDGTAPEFEGMLALAWGFVRPKIDRDLQEYERTVLRRQYATFCRERKKKGEPELSFEEWLLSHNHHMISPDAPDGPWYPATATAPAATPPTATATNTITITNPAAAPGAQALAAAAAERKLKKLNGALGQGAVNLSDYQIDRLLEMMGVDMFDYYVTKLANFILREGASVKNHYSTIIKWWTEDSTC